MASWTMSAKGMAGPGDLGGPLLSQKRSRNRRPRSSSVRSLAEAEGARGRRTASEEGPVASRRPLTSRPSHATPEAKVGGNRDAGAGAIGGVGNVGSVSLLSSRPGGRPASGWASGG